MAYTVTQTALAGVLVLEPKVFGDARGSFYESYNARSFREATGLARDFVQDNHSRSSRGVLRGLHYQLVKPQGKLVRVTSGEIYDVAVDLRSSSPTFRQWTGVWLSAGNHRQLWVPEGFAHGFLVTSDMAEVQYKTTEYWMPEHDRSLRFDDVSVAIEWPLQGEPVLAAKDASAPTLSTAEIY